MRAFSVMILLLLGVGVGAQAQPAPPGELIQVDENTLHLHCTGQGNPTIILEAGIGGFSMNWVVVQPILSETYRVCSYDRLGYGWSDTQPGPFDIDQAIYQLHTLLAEAGESPPYVLVGHSFGGVLTRAYQAAYPDEVIGMLLLDAVHPELAAEIPSYPPALRRQLDQLDILVGLMQTMVAGDNRMAPLDTFIPDGLDPMYVEKMLKPTFINTSRLEATYMLEDLAEVTLPASLDQLPLAVVTHGIPEQRSFLGAPLSAQEAVAAEATWQALQRELADLSVAATFVVAEESRHNIQFDQPDIVVRLVHVLVEQANP